LHSPGDWLPRASRSGFVFVLVPGWTDDMAEVERIAAPRGLGNVERVDVLPFHPDGRFKWEKLAMDIQLKDTRRPRVRRLTKAIAIFRAAGLKALNQEKSNFHCGSGRVAAGAVYITTSMRALRAERHDAQLTEAFGVNALGVSAIVGMFYYSYSPYSSSRARPLIASARNESSDGAALVGVGALLFGTGNVAAATSAGSCKAPGRVSRSSAPFIWSRKTSPPAMAASFIGCDANVRHGRRSAGQFLVGPLNQHGLPWGQFWIYAGLVGLATARDVCVLPRKSENSLRARVELKALVGRWEKCSPIQIHPLCLISGFLFIPTTIPP